MERTLGSANTTFQSSVMNDCYLPILPSLPTMKTPTTATKTSQSNPKPSTARRITFQEVRWFWLLAKALFLPRQANLVALFFGLRSSVIYFNVQEVLYHVSEKACDVVQYHFLRACFAIYNKHKQRVKFKLIQIHLHSKFHSCCHFVISACLPTIDAVSCRILPYHTIISHISPASRSVAGNRKPGRDQDHLAPVAFPFLPLFCI